MNECESPHPDYLKGFNEGYLISKHLPDLAEKLSSAIIDSSYGKGFKGGQEQYLNEEKEERRPSWMKARTIPDPETSSDRSREKEKNDLEPER